MSAPCSPPLDDSGPYPSKAHSLLKVSNHPPTVSDESFVPPARAPPSIIYTALLLLLLLLLLPTTLLKRHNLCCCQHRCLGASQIIQSFKHIIRFSVIRFRKPIVHEKQLPGWASSHSLQYQALILRRLIRPLSPIATQ